MSRPNAFKLKSIFVKIAVVLVLAVGAVAATLTYQKQQTQLRMVSNMTAERAKSEARLVAMQAGGPLKFDKPSPLRLLLDDVIATSGGAALGAIAMTTEGEIALTNADFSPAGTGLRALAEASLETGEATVSESGFGVAVPVRYGAQNEMVGAIAMLWSPESELAEVRRDAWRTLAIGGLVFLIATGIAIVAAGWLIVSPLGRLRGAISAIGSGDYATDVPGSDRADEIGEIGRTVEALRSDLEKTAEVQKEVAFKGAAFTGSSSALMLIDEELVIRHVNPRLEELMARHASNAGGAAARADYRNLVGKSFDSFHPGKAELRARVLELQDTMVEILSFGEARIRLSISPVRMPDGRRLGYLMEWADVTQESLNGATIDAIETAQVKADFDNSGRFLESNARFQEALETGAGALNGRSLGDLIVSGPDGSGGETPSGEEIMRRLA